MRKLRAMRYLGALLLAGITFTATASAAASDSEDNKAVQNLLQLLRAKGNLTEHEYQDLRSQLKIDEEKQAVSKAELENKIKAQPTISIKKGKFKVTSADGNFSAAIGGRIEYNATIVTDRDDAPGIAGSGDEVRRARIALSGVLWHDWLYKLQYDFAGDGSLKDAYLKYQGNAWPVTIGHHKEPFGLEALTSSKYNEFSERSLPNLAGFWPGRSNGISTHGHFLEKLSLGAGLFYGDSDGGEGESFAIANRLTFSPIHEKGKALHFAVAGNYRNYKTRQAQLLRYRARPEVHTINDRLVDTGANILANVSSRMLYGVEAAAVWGPFSLQGEYMWVDVKRATGAEPRFSGYYVKGVWFLTGERRKYNWKNGVFKQVRVKKPFDWRREGSYGAWALAARFSGLDLNDSGIEGGALQNTSLALNWYPNENLKFVLDWTRVLKLNRSGSALNGRHPSFLTLASYLYW